MPREFNPHLRKAVLQVVTNQLRANDPPETRETLDRLVGAGHSKEDAKRLIGCVVACEIFQVMRDHREFDNVKFVRALRGLPTLPWDQPESGYD